MTAWCAQHDEKDYRPRPGRTYELASLSGAESVGVVRLLMSLEDSHSVASWLSSNELIYGTVPTPEEITERIDAVTVADVQALARDLFTPERFSLAVVGPYDDEARFLKLLETTAA